MSSFKHGHALKAGFSPEYHSWSSMIQRCTNPKRKHWQHYGGRGIAVCEAWMTFELFLADMGPRPAGTSLERKNLGKGYSPDNCVWADRVTQARNSSQVVWVTIAGETKRLVEWCEELKISVNTVRCRVRKHGWTYVEALTRPRQDLTRRGPRGRLLPKDQANA